MNDWLEIELHITGEEADVISKDRGIQLFTRKLLDPGSSDPSGLVDFVPVVSVTAFMPALKFCGWLAGVLESSTARGVMADLRRTPPLVTTVEHIKAGSILIIDRDSQAARYEGSFDCGDLARALGIQEPVG